MQDRVLCEAGTNQITNKLHWAQSFLSILTGPRLVKKFPAFYVALMFFVAFTIATGSCPQPDQSNSCLPIQLLTGPF